MKDIKSMKNTVNVSINEKYLGDAQQLDIISVFGKKNLEEIQQVISDVTGLAFVTVDYKGEPVTEPTGFTRFCQKMRNDAQRQLLCKLSDASGAIVAATSKQTSIYFCPCGLLEVAIPIVVNDRYLGGFVGGQIKCHDAPPYIMRISKNMTSVGRDLEEIDIDSSPYKEDLEGATTYTYNEFVSISKLVELIINQLTKHALISGHNKMENLNRIGELEERVRELEYKNNLLKNRYDDISRSANVFFSRNIFTMISNLSILEGAKKTHDAILKYANFITEEMQEREEFRICEELRRVENFMEINKIRYEGRIFYDVEVKEKVSEQRIPFSLILPFIQASVYYSMNTLSKNYRLQILVSLEEQNVKIQIIDNGVCLKIPELEKKYQIYGKNHEGILLLRSIKNVMKSMETNFGKEYQIQIFNESEKEEQKIIIKYPINFDEGLKYV